jgi:hypothetical protein
MTTPLRDLFPDAYVVLTDDQAREVSERHPVKVYLAVGQTATPRSAGTVEILVDRTVQLTYKAARDTSIALAICTAADGLIIEARRVPVRRGETANLSVTQSEEVRRRIRDGRIAVLERDLDIGGSQ